MSEYGKNNFKIILIVVTNEIYKKSHGAMQKGIPLQQKNYSNSPKQKPR
jgi:hypothetical protein